MWADDLEIVESCGFDLSLSYSDSINSISVFAATDTFAHMKGPTHGGAQNGQIWKFLEK